ncbi:MAG: hypothetical protein KIT25_15820 [Enhydrobacter sp.]|nr:MAG: hypothetical protein KIT25_15820 [Enhydrobacter sp.]
MHHRLVAAVLAALSIAVCAGAQAQSPAPPAADTAARPNPAVTVTPIKDFSDAAGRWHGSVDLTKRVTMYVAPDGMVQFWGPYDVVQRATIANDMLQIRSRNTDLDCIIRGGSLACNARFGTWYAALSLRKQQ